jgi:hypothetical protein
MDKLNIYQKLAVIKKTLKVKKDAENKFSNFKYATLDAILEQLNPMLEECGLSFDIISYQDNHPHYEIKAVLSDADSDKVIEYNYTISGAVITTKAKGESMDQFVYKMQDAGSAITYCTRYVYGTVFAIPFQEDEIQKNTGNPDAKASTNVKPSYNNEPLAEVTHDQASKIVSLLANPQTKGKGYAYFKKINNQTKIDVTDYEKIQSALKIAYPNNK